PAAGRALQLLRPGRGPGRPQEQRAGDRRVGRRLGGVGMLRALRIALGIVIAAAALIAPAEAQAPLGRLTLDEAVAAAVANNPQLRAKTLEVSSAQAGEITAVLIPNPQASYTATQLGTRAQQEQHTVTFGQTIETGGKRQRRVESAQAATTVTRQELFDVRR